jgi:hypothetical protein
MVIDYTQLNLDFKLYSCQVLFNRGLCYIELGEMDLGMTDLWRATREKQTKEHDSLDQALRDRGQDCTVFTVPHGVLYRPPESKVKNSKKKDYLGNSKVIAALDDTDSYAGFKAKSAWQLTTSGPTNIAVTNENASPMTPPNGMNYNFIHLYYYFQYYCYYYYIIIIIIIIHFSKLHDKDNILYNTYILLQQY